MPYQVINFLYFIILFFDELFQSLHEDILSQQADMDLLTDSAQQLTRLSSDTRATSQAAQVNSRYQTLGSKVKVSQS